MSNYTIAVAWSGKDALSDSNPAKVISGSDFNTEFTAVQTAVNTKANLNGSASESFSAITAAAGTNTTQVATTAFVETATSAANIADTVYPVGAIFTTVTAYADSAAVVAAIGGTTWVAFAAGKMLIGLDSSDTDFDTVEETGGTKTHTLTESEMPSHQHFIVDNGTVAESGDITASNTVSEIATQGGSTYQSYVMRPGTGDAEVGLSSVTGGDTAHSIMNPYIAVYMWKRTA